MADAWLLKTLLGMLMLPPTNALLLLGLAGVFRKRRWSFGLAVFAGLLMLAQCLPPVSGALIATLEDRAGSVLTDQAGAQAIVMAENRGMPVAAMTQLRAKARASGVYFRVVKNTLVRRAVEKNEITGESSAAEARLDLGAPGRVAALALAGDGKRLFVGGDDGTLRCYALGDFTATPADASGPAQTAAPETATAPPIE